METDGTGDRLERPRGGLYDDRLRVQSTLASLCLRVSVFQQSLLLHTDDNRK